MAIGLVGQVVDLHGGARMGRGRHQRGGGHDRGAERQTQDRRLEHRPLIPISRLAPSCSGAPSGLSSHIYKTKYSKPDEREPEEPVRTSISGFEKKVREMLTPLGGGGKLIKS
ncbi:hypothetical protein D3C72_1282270 [compost metagenome]